SRRSCDPRRHGRRPRGGRPDRSASPPGARPRRASLSPRRTRLRPALTRPAACYPFHGSARSRCRTRPGVDALPPARVCKDAAMARTGLLPLACLCAFLITVLLLPVSADPPGDTSQGIQTSLLVQTTIVQANKFLLDRDPAKAVRILEDNLSRIDGNA